MIAKFWIDHGGGRVEARALGMSELGEQVPDGRHLTWNLPTRGSAGRVDRGNGYQPGYA